MESVMELQFEKGANDIRGKVAFLRYGNKRINLVETKKGFSRGGHYHDFESRHILISGLVEYREKNLQTNVEKIQIFSAPDIITTPPLTPHLITAIADSVFAEEFEQDYSAADYLEYRKIVTQKMI
jgi:quercetin dioxygenase-like cupin family protein